MKKIAIILWVCLNLTGFPAGQSRNPANANTPGLIRKIVVDIEMTDVFLSDCHLWIRYTNKGTVKIDKVLRELVRVEGVVVCDDQAHVLLDPGAYIAVAVGTGEGKTISGTKTVKAEIDPDNALNESSATRANNTKEVQLKCLLQMPPGGAQVMKPDLTVALGFKNMTHNDSSGHIVYSCNIEFTVSNLGAGGAGPCSILLEKDSGPGGAFVPCGPEISVAAVAGYHSLTITTGPYQHTGPAPTYRATVDCHNAVIETNENNNNATRKFPG